MSNRSSQNKNLKKQDLKTDLYILGANGKVYHKLLDKGLFRSQCVI